MVIMEEEDEYFPRGGAEGQKKSIVSDRRYIFEKKKSPLTMPKKKLGKRERQREKAKKVVLENNSEEEEVDIMVVPEPLTYKNLTEGTWSMCSIMQVHSSHLLVSLPERLTAKVPINLISQPLNARMEKGASNNVPLIDYFPPGFCLPCRVMNVSQESNSYTVTVTTDPSQINSYIPFGLVSKGYTLVAAVESCEDHGYIMTTGITGLNAFLPHEKTVDYLKKINLGKQLGVGQLVWCKVVKSTLSETSNVVELTIEPDVVSSAILKEVSSADILTPGVQVNVNVVKVMPKLLQVEELASNKKGFILSSQLENVWSKTSDYQEGMECTATVLFRFPIVDHVWYSLRIKPNTVYRSEINNGTVFNRAKVINKDGRGIYLKLKHDDETYKGVISMARLKNKIDAKKLDELFPLGNHVTVRVLNFHNLDGMYSCTTTSNLLQEGSHASEMKVGQLVDVNISQKSKNGLLGKIVETNTSVFVPLCHIKDTVEEDPAKNITINKKHSGRILTKQDKRNSVVVTLCPSLVSHKPLTDFNQVKQGEEYFGIIRQTLDDSIVLTFFNDLTGQIRESELPKRPKKYKVGEVVKCYILKVDQNRKPFFSIIKPVGLIQLKIGNQYEILVKSVTDKQLNCLVLENGKSSECVLPVEHLSDCLKLCPLFLKKYEIWEKIENAILYTFDGQKPIFTLRYSVKKFFENNPEIKEKGIHALKNNDCLPATVSSIGENDTLLFVPLPGYNGKVSTRIEKPVRDTLKINQGIIVTVRNVQPNAKSFNVTYQKPLAPTYLFQQLKIFLFELSKLMERTPGEEMNVTVTSKDENVIGVLLPDGSKGVITKRINKNYKIGEKITAILLYEDLIEKVSRLCHKSHDLSQGKDPRMRIVYLNDDFCIGVTLSSHKVVFLNSISQNLLKMWEEKHGTSLLYSKVFIKAPKIRTYGKFSLGFVKWAKSLKFLTTLANKHNNKTSEDKKVDEKQKEENLDSDNESDVDEPMLEVEKTSSDEEAEMEIEEPKKKSLKKKTKEIEKVTPKKKKRKISEVEVTPSRWIVTEMDAIEVATEEATPSKKKKKDNNKKNSGRNSFSEEPLNEEKKNKKRSLDASLSNDEEEILNVKTKRANINNKLSNIKNDQNIKESKAAKALKERKLKELENLSLEGVGGFDWDVSPTDLAKDVSKERVDDIEEDSDEEVVVKKKLTPAERKAAQLDAEKSIREKEEELLRCEENPQSADHFDRLLLGRPNDSKLWIHYMAFHMQGTDIDKARSVARRALKQINVREEQERFNVWIALLNLENIYGSPESFEKTLAEALKYNDDYQIYMKTLGMCCASQKINELDKLTNYLVRKFKDRPNCWLECQSALMRAGLPDKARNLLQRALTTLAKKEHITLISRFALLENKHGFQEQAQSLFENLLTSYPQRVDLWNVYVDMLIKSGSVELARSVLERVQSHKLPARKMKAIYKKWLQFEEKYGTENSVERVRQAAESYVNDFLIKKDKNYKEKENDNDNDDKDSENEESEEDNEEEEEEKEAKVEKKKVDEDEEEDESDDDDDDSDEGDD